MKKRKIFGLLSLMLAVLLALTSCLPLDLEQTTETTTQQAPPPAPYFDLSSIPAYTSEPYVALNGNVPSFTTDQYTTTSYEIYSTLDALGRCGVAMACIGIDLMPTEERDDIGSVKPSGWQSVKYDHISGKYLYNRCHLIGFQLSGENANEKNLITGTRYLNIEGMLPFENMIADYVKETENHVLFRVTPIYEGNNLVASGVQMEAYSVEDNGAEICFNVYAYNVQPGVVINYADGTSYLAGTIPPEDGETNPEVKPDDSELQTYILNTDSKKFHKETCSHANNISADNRDTYTGNRNDLLDLGYIACGTCKP